MRFAPTDSVSEAVKEIASKNKMNLESTADRGIFQPAIAGKNTPRWLKLNRTLAYYDIPPDSLIDGVLVRISPSKPT